MVKRTRCTRACPASEHVHYTSCNRAGSWYTLEREPRSGDHTSWIERVRAANWLQRLIPQLRRPKW